MKWLKHHSDSYSNFKHQQVIAKFGLRGYGLYWFCVELVAQQGQNFRIKADKSWKVVLLHLTRETEKEMDAMLSFFADITLIDKKGLEMGDLYIPKMKEHADEYTKKVRRVSGQSREKVVLEQNRTEEEEKRRYEPIDFDLATLLRDRIKTNIPTFKEPNMDMWAGHIRLMRERDNRTEVQIRYVVEWCQKDNFWQANILSTKKLREKFDTLVAQIKRKVNQGELSKAKVAFV